MEREFVVIEPNIWKPENTDDKIEGRLIAKKEKIGPNESNVYNIENEQGTFSIWGSTILDDRMNFVNVGEHVRITYKGKETNKKGQPVKIFKVEKSK